MKKKQPAINLLRHQEKAALDKFLDWAFTVGRPIIIIVQAVALSAFAYRFFLDKQIIDLHDSIKQEQSIVVLSKTNEDKFRNLQNRLTVIKQFDSTSRQKPDVLKSILAAAKGKMSFTAISITTNSVALTGAAQSIGQLSQFVQKLRELPIIQTVSVNNIQTNTASGIITVSITTTLKTAP